MASGRDDLIRTIDRLAREVSARRGLEIVEIVYRSQGKHSLLRIDVERPGPVGVSLEDCEGLSRDLDPLLERVEGLPESGYELQVSSPGLERPLRSDDDFRRNLGRRLEVETSQLVLGRRTFVGILEESPPGCARLRLDDAEIVDIPRGLIGLARQDLGIPGGSARVRHRPGRSRRRGIV